MLAKTKGALATSAFFPFSAHYLENSRWIYCRFEAWLALIVGQELLNSHLPQWSDLPLEISSRCPLFNRFEHLIQLMKLLFCCCLRRRTGVEQIQVSGFAATPGSLPFYLALCPVLTGQWWKLVLNFVMQRQQSLSSLKWSKCWPLSVR